MESVFVNGEKTGVVIRPQKMPIKILKHMPEVLVLENEFFFLVLFDKNDIS